MAWGYWTAHALAPSRGRPRSLSPAPIPIPMVGNREHSLDRERPSIVKLCHTPESGSGPRCGGSGSHSDHVSPGSHDSHSHSHSSHKEYHEHSSHERDTDWSDTDRERPDRTKDRDRDRNTLPRVKVENDVCPSAATHVPEQRHTLPRGRSECESHGWPESAGLPQCHSHGHHSSHNSHNSHGARVNNTEAECCPGCQSGPVSNVSSCR